MIVCWIILNALVIKGFDYNIDSICIRKKLTNQLNHTRHIFRRYYFVLNLISLFCILISLFYILVLLFISNLFFFCTLVLLFVSLSNLPYVITVEMKSSINTYHMNYPTLIFVNSVTNIRSRV